MEDTMQFADVKNFGQYLRVLRVDAGISLVTLATKLDVTKGYVSRLERGKSRPSVAMIQRIAEVMEVDPTPLYVLAGHLPNDVKEIFHSHPVEASTVLRETFGHYDIGLRTAQVGQTPGPRSPLSEWTYGKETGNLYEAIHDDCFDWLQHRAENSIHAVVTDPPYGLREYSEREKTKLRCGKGGVWRIPPNFGGCIRKPLPRFTILTGEEKAELRSFFLRWAILVFRVLVPGGHVFIATNPLVSHFVYLSMTEAGFEKRGEIIRLVQTLRGGDRPKNAHKEFEYVTVMPRSCWEPWGLFRKPCEGRVQDNLRKWKTGGLRRISDEQPFCDVIRSAPTRNIERDIAPHPSLKPQAFIRQVVRAALPLGEGVILDPFMGSGSTIAAACALGYRSIGIESDPEFYQMALAAIPQLAALPTNGNGLAARTMSRNGVQQVLFEK